jgi:hypothetical protein
MPDRSGPDDEETTRRETVAGLVNLMLVSQWRTWVTSRFEAIDFPDRSTARRVATVTLAPPVLTERTGRRGADCLPLTLLSKGRSSSIVVTDEAGALVPVLNRIESETLGREVLAALAAALTRGEAADDEGLQRLITSCATATAGSAAEALSDLGAYATDSALSGLNTHLFWTLAQDIATNYFLFALLPSDDGRPRRVLVYETKEGYASLRRSVLALPRLLGWTSTTVGVATPSVGRGAVYEVSIVAPEGTRVVAARMMSSTGSPATTVLADASGVLPVTLSVTGMAQNSTGSVIFELAPTTSYLSGVLATAVLAAVVLLLGTLQVETLVDRVAPATTLLLAGPALFAGLVAQPGRGSVGAQLLVAARGVLLLTGLLTFFAAATLVAVACPKIVERVWIALAAAAWASVGVLVISLISPGTRRKARRYVAR